MHACMCIFKNYLYLLSPGRPWLDPQPGKFLVAGGQILDRGVFKNVFIPFFGWEYKFDPKKSVEELGKKSV